jgi:hypothetical protein
MAWGSAIDSIKQTFRGNLTSCSVRSVRSFSSTAVSGTGISAGLAGCPSLASNTGNRKSQGIETGMFGRFVG